MKTRGAATAASWVALALLASIFPPRGVGQPPLGAAPAPADSVSEIKAEFLFHFGAYVEWPDTALGTETFTIAVLGDDAVAEELERRLPGRSIQGREARVQRLDSIEELAGQVLYVGPAENQRLEQVLTYLVERPTLLVTDAPDALTAGAMINFLLVDERVRFEIAITPAEQAGLRLRAPLLAAAERVETSNCGGSCAPVGQRSNCRPRAPS